MAVNKNKGPSLDAQVKTYWQDRSASGVLGLKLLVTCIERTAKYRDWDALSRFITQAGDNESARSKVVKIVRAAFGDSLTYKVNSKHDTGGTIVMGWEGSLDLSKSNTYGHVRDAARNGLSWHDKEFLKLLPGPTPKAKDVNAVAHEKAGQHLAKYLLQREAEGFTIGDIIAQMQAEIKKAHAEKAAKAPAGKVKATAKIIEVAA